MLYLSIVNYSEGDYHLFKHLNNKQINKSPRITIFITLLLRENEHGSDYINLIFE